MRALLKRLFPKAMLWQASRRHFWREYWMTGEWELRELKRYVDPRKGAVDVGGNVGIYAYHLNRLAKWVRIFEANSAYAERLSALGLSAATVEPVGLSDAPGTATLRIPTLTDGSEAGGMASLEASVVSDANLGRTLEVELRTLDSYRLDDIGFLKIDVEGHEEAVLAGARDTIARNRPVLLIEIEERHNRGGLSRIADSLQALGYHAYFFDGRVRRPFADFAIDRHQVVTAALEAASHDRRALPYVNNFLFLPSAAA